MDSKIKENKNKMQTEIGEIIFEEKTPCLNCKKKEARSFSLFCSFSCKQIYIHKKEES